MDKDPSIDETLREYYAMWLVQKGITILSASRGNDINLGSIEKEILYHLGELTGVMNAFAPLMATEMDDEIMGEKSNTTNRVDIDDPFTSYISMVNLFVGYRKYKEDKGFGEEYLLDEINRLRTSIVTGILELFDPLTIRRVQKELSNESKT